MNFILYANITGFSSDSHIYQWIGEAGDNPKLM